MRLYGKQRKNPASYCQKNKNIKLSVDESRKSAFSERFWQNYDMIENEFMTKETKALDAHKQAAVSVISMLESGIITYETNIDNRICIAPYAAALTVGLSYLCDRMNEILGDIEKKPITLYLPMALACDTPYFDIMCRMLYYEDPNSDGPKPMPPTSYNILEWADRFFMIEYITLLENGLNPYKVKDIIARMWKE